MNYQELYKPYEGIATLDMTIGWLNKQALSLGIRGDIVQKAINDTFLEMEGGKTFPTDGGDTNLRGVPNAALDHYILKKMILFNKVATDGYNLATEGILQKRIDLIVKLENKKFFDAVKIQERWFRRLLNCNNSYIIRAIEWAVKELRNRIVRPGKHFR